MRLGPYARQIAIITVLLIVGLCVVPQLSPATPKDNFDLALYSVNSGDLETAERLVRKLQRADGFEAHCELLHGGLALRTGQIDEALACFSRVHPQGDLEQPLLMWTGEALYKAGRLVYSLNCFNRIIERSPEHQSAHRWIAAISFDLGAMDDALRHLQCLVELNPQDINAHRLLGTIYFDFEKWRHAENSFRKAFQGSREHPLHQKIGCEFARSLLKQREYDQAALVCGALSADENVLAIQSECAWVSGDLRGATEIIRKALADFPGSLAANLLAGRIYLESGQPELAIACLESAIKADPFEFDSHFLLTSAFRQLGETEKAERQFEIQEKVREFRVRMAELNDRAIKNPFDADVRVELAQLCRTMGHLELARIWERAAQGCSESETNSPTNAWIPKEQQIEF